MACLWSRMVSGAAAISDEKWVGAGASAQIAAGIAKVQQDSVRQIGQLMKPGVRPSGVWLGTSTGTWRIAPPEQMTSVAPGSPADAVSAS
jgi:hypothetical protein